MKSVGEAMASGARSKSRCRRPCAGSRSARAGLRPMGRTAVRGTMRRRPPREASDAEASRMPRVADAFRRAAGAWTRCIDRQRIDPWFLGADPRSCGATRDAFQVRGLGAPVPTRPFAGKEFGRPQIAQLRARASGRARAAQAFGFGLSSSWWIRVRRSSRRHAHLYSTYGEEGEARTEEPAANHDHRRRAEPDRAGYRIRLLLRPRFLRAARGGFETIW